MSLILILTSSYAPQIARADGWSGLASVDATGEYDDNPRLATGDQEGAFGLSVSLTLAIRKVLPRTTFNASGTLDINTFEGNGGDDGGGGDLDSIDQHVRADIATKTRRSTVEFGASFDRETTRTSEVEDTGVLSEDATRVSIGGNARYSYLISRRNFLDVFADAQDVSFDTDELSDFRTYGGGGGFRHVLSRQDELGLFADYSRFDSESADEKASDVLSGRASWSRQVSPRLSFDVSVGGEFVRSDTPGSGYETSIGFILAGDLNWAPSERDTIGLSVERSAQPSGTGVLQERNKVSANYRRVLTRSVEFGLNFDFILQDAVEQSGTGERTFYQAEPTVSWNFLPDWAVSTSYRYRRQKFDSGDESAVSNAFFLTIRYTSPYVSLF